MPNLFKLIFATADKEDEELEKESGYVYNYYYYYYYYANPCFLSKIILDLTLLIYEFGYESELVCY